MKKRNPFIALPFSERLRNSLGYLAKPLGFSAVSRSVDSLMAEASRLVGSEDWGEESFREPLELLLESCRELRALTPRGWYRIHRLLACRLANRLTIREELQRRPEILKETLERPIVITGLPRTGTTFLQRLLAQDPANRTLRWYETLHTVPFRLAGSGIDARVAHAAAFLRDLYRLSPAYGAIHRMTISTPEECTPLLMNSFKSWGFGLCLPVDGYARWLETQDLTPSYVYYRKQLQILQTQARGERWLLKAPNHLRALGSLLSVLPDACIVQTHRDPTRVVPSTASLVATWWGMNLRRFSLRGLGRGILAQQAACVRQASAIRDRQPDPGQFFDVLYPELMADPMAVTRRLYDHFRLAYTPEAEGGMRRYLEKNPKNRFGVHRYSLEQFGLGPEKINEQFVAYRERFGIGVDEGRATARAASGACRP